MTPSDRPSSPWMGQFCTVRNLSDGPLHGEQHFCKNKKLVLLKTKLFQMESCRQLANLPKGRCNVAIFYLRTSIVRASSGKSAVASSAYITAQTLYSERLKRTFSYSDKEEAAYSEGK